MTQPNWNAQPIEEAVKTAIESAIPQSMAEVTKNGNHFSIKVISPEFKGKNSLQKQRLVYTAITPFMAGADAPIHAVDHLQTLVPEGG